MPINKATRKKHVIEWVNQNGEVLDAQISSTRLSRAKRHVERLRNSRKDENLTPRLRSQ